LSKQQLEATLWVDGIECSYGGILTDFYSGTGCRMPTQVPSGRSVCFCGAIIGIQSMEQHVYAAHLQDA